ncbi:MAG: M14 family metallopeptidase [Chloroflexi bacterium]|nr:M14 family metallopeptidase [Chloroflexota bacterium]
MTTLTFNHYYRYAELTDILNGFADSFPGLCRLVSLGKSFEGRDIWCVTLTNTATGPDTDKPAFWVDANIHATEVSPSVCAVYTINKILSGYANDARVTRLLDTRALYIVPRMNPDGSELYLDDRHRTVRSSTRPYPRLDHQNGLYEYDVDGDGRTLTMRIKDPNGPWKAHPADPRLMIPRDPDDSNDGEPHYRLLPEGLIRNYDGVNIKIAPRLEGLDLNRNFPVEWVVESEQRGAGPYPASEPEVRSVVQFVIDHPNITGAITYHTYAGAYLRPYSAHPDDYFKTEDLWTYQEIGKAATRITGYPAVSVFHDFKYHPKETTKGAFDDWMYDHLGVYAWTCEIWGPQQQAGIDMKKPGGGYQFIEWYREHSVEDDLKLLKWSDEKLDGKGFVDWYPFKHPQLGEIELGGWHDEYCWRNPPPSLLEKEIAPHADFIIWHALISPRIEFNDVQVQAIGGDAFHICVVIQNTGWLPTPVSGRAQEKQLVRPLEIEIALPVGGTLVSGQPRVEAGQLGGRALKITPYESTDPTDDRAKVEWVVQAPKGSVVTIKATHQRAGTISRAITL